VETPNRAPKGAPYDSRSQRCCEKISNSTQRRQDSQTRGSSFHCRYAADCGYPRFMAKCALPGMLPLNEIADFLVLDGRILVVGGQRRRNLSRSDRDTAHGEVNSPLCVRARQGVSPNVASPSLAMSPARARMPAPRLLGQLYATPGRGKLTAMRTSTPGRAAERCIAIPGDASCAGRDARATSVGAALRRHMAR